MADPTTHKWYSAYQAAVFSTSPGTLRDRIAEALSVIKARLDSPPPIDDTEHNEIQDAMLVLKALSDEYSSE
jgi:hypothetical protein